LSLIKLISARRALLYYTRASLPVSLGHTEQLPVVKTHFKLSCQVKTPKIVALKGDGDGDGIAQRPAAINKPVSNFYELNSKTQLLWAFPCW